MPPCDLDDLQPAEQLLLLACRRSLAGRVAGPCVELAWRLGCGDRLGATSARAFRGMTRVLDRETRRPLRLEAPHTRHLSVDERSLLGLVCACQCGACELASSLARWLVRSPAHLHLLGHAACLARAMERAGLRLRPASAFRLQRAEQAFA